MIRIFVGNLPWQTSETELRRAFERYGRVNSVSVMTDFSTGKAKGFAFVNMPSMEDADEAITRLNGTTLGGRSLTVNEARRRDEPGVPVAAAPRRPSLLDLL